jgi:hypothetical protein
MKAAERVAAKHHGSRSRSCHLPFLEIIPAGERVSLATLAPVRACSVVRAGTRRVRS